MGAACCSDISKPAAALPILGGAFGFADGTPPPAGGSAAGPSEPAAVAAVSEGPTGQCQNAGVEEAPDQFVSQVGELPRFSKQQDQSSGAGDNQSEVSGASGQESVSEMVDGLTAKEQKAQARQIVKDFVREMVKGKKISVMKQNGQLTTCTVSITRDLANLKIKAGSAARSVSLRDDVEEIHAGGELEGIDTPADDLCATLMLASGDCITFRLADINARDTFVCCIQMFCNGGAA